MQADFYVFVYFYEKYYAFGVCFLGKKIIGKGANEEKNLFRRLPARHKQIFQFSLYGDFSLVWLISKQQSQTQTKTTHRILKRVKDVKKMMQTVLSTTAPPAHQRQTQAKTTAQRKTN